MKQVLIDTLKIHDIAIPNLGFYLDSKITGVGSADIRQTSYNISGGHGGYASKTRYGARLIGLTGQVYGNDITTYIANSKALSAALRLREDANGIDLPKTLYFTGNDGSLYQIQGIPQDITNDDEGVMQSPFMVNFYCGFPYFLKQAQSNQVLRRPSGGGVTLPFVVPVTLGAQTGGSVICTNGGTAETYPLITLQGPLTNPVIQNLTTGLFMKLAMTIALGDTVVINMTPPIPSIVLNDLQDVFNNKTDTSDFWFLEVGDNLISLSTDDSGDTGTMTVQWNDAYLAIK